MSTLRYTARTLRASGRSIRCLPSTSRVPARALSHFVRPSVSTISHLPLYRLASHSATPPSHTPPSVVGAELRTTIENELEILRNRLTQDDSFLHPLSGEETEFVNMGQVPAPPQGGEVMALLDLAPPGISRDRPSSPAGGTHVPLLAHVGQTEPAVPCYPLVELFQELAPRVLGRIREAVAAQGREVGQANLVAVVVPKDGEKRDLAIPLAIALFRLAMFEGNGQGETFA